MDENNTVTPPAPLSFKDNDFAADIAKIAAQSQQAVVVPPQEVLPVIPPPPTPAQPEAPAATTPQAEATKEEVVVPEKFKTPDGGVDAEKLAKSTLNVDEALAKYLEKEKELKRKMNEVRAQENAYINPPPPPNAPPPVIPVNTTFAAQLEADVARDGFGVVAAKLFTAAQQSAVEQLQGEINALKGVNAENTTKEQVKAIGKNDPWVYTPDGINTLNRILSEQPYLQKAEDPYKAAYLLYRGQVNVASQSNSQVLTPTPQARPSAPVPTGQAANKTHAPVIKLDTREAIDNHLKTLNAEQQKEFFKRAGLPSY